eukprot:14650881-Alexandrium_andersonii.AAC.1
MYMRKELHRIIGGLHMRVVLPLSDAEAQLWLALDAPQADRAAAVVAAQARCEGLPCCQDAAARARCQWLRNASVEQLEASRKILSPFILKTEVAHAGNQRRQRQLGQRPRTWRRQVSTAICVAVLSSVLGW